MSVKKLLSFLKTSMRDAQDNEQRSEIHKLTKITQSNAEESNIINKQFKSSFTPVSPLRLSQVSESDLLNGLSDSNINAIDVAGRSKPKFPEMSDPYMHIASRCFKMFACLGPTKDTGIDAIKTVMLRSLRNHIAHYTLGCLSKIP